VICFLEKQNSFTTSLIIVKIFIFKTVHQLTPETVSKKSEKSKLSYFVNLKIWIVMIWKNKQSLEISSSLSEKKDLINKSEFFRGFKFLEEIKLDNRLANPEFNC